MALAAYRHVLRSISLVFRNDAAIYTQARHQARHTFREHRHSPADQAAEQIEHAEQVATLLRRNVVQGERVGGGSGDAGAGAGEKEGKQETYRLRIHADTELGDNESVKMGVGMGRREMGSLAGAQACALPASATANTTHGVEKEKGRKS